MTLNSFLPRLMLIPLLVMSLLTVGWTAAETHCPRNQQALAQTGHSCCQPNQSAACCDGNCCQSSAPQPLPAEKTRDQQLRPDESQPLLAIVPAPPAERQSSLERHRSTLSVPASGSPSLIALHIRLQI